MNDLQSIAKAVARIDQGVAKLLEAQVKTAAEWLSVAQVAEISGLSDTTVRRAIGRGELAASNMGGERRPVWRIAQQELAAWMEMKRGGTKAVPPGGELDDLVKRYFGSSDD